AAGGRLAAAVSLAGGLGMIGMGSAGSAAALERELGAFGDALAAHTAPTPPPLGIGMVDWGVAKHPDMLERAIAARPAVISVSFGDWNGPSGSTSPTDNGATAPDWVAQVKAAGLRTIAQIATVEEAKAAAEAGIDAVVARGLE